jgi:hypothetical protein
MTALMLEPTAGLWNGLMDRMEGKVSEVVQVGHQLEIESLYEMIEKVYGNHED